MNIHDDIPPFVEQLVKNISVKPKLMTIKSTTGGKQDEFEYNLEWYEDALDDFPSSRSSSAQYASARSNGSSSLLSTTSRNSIPRVVKLPTECTCFRSTVNVPNYHNFDKIRDKNGASAIPLKNISSSDSLRLPIYENAASHNEVDDILSPLNVLRDWIGVRVSDLSTTNASTPSLISVASQKGSTPTLKPRSANRCVMPESPALSSSKQTVLKHQPTSSDCPSNSSLVFTTSTTGTRDSRWDRIVQNDFHIAENSDSRCSNCVIL